jgi:hypothetical protein
VFLLVVVSIPAIGLLFMQNKQVQTTVSEYLTEKLSEDLGVLISLSSVRYNFFKRLHVYDLMIEDQQGDTLIYAEVVSARMKRFRPDKKDIQIQKIFTENSLLQLHVGDDQTNNMKFLIDHLKRDLPPEEKAVLQIQTIETKNTTFRYTNEIGKSSENGIDFKDLHVKGIDAVVRDFLFHQDTTTMHVVSAIGIDKSGFLLEGASFLLSVGKQFLTFRDGMIASGTTVARLPLVDFRFRTTDNFRYLYDSVDVRIVSQDSRLAFDNVKYFFPQLEKLKGTVMLNGALTGTFGNLTGSNMYLTSGSQTVLDMDMKIEGLPDTDRLSMQFNVRNFTTHLDEFHTLTSRFNMGKLHDSLFAASAGLVKYTGSFRGNTSNFKTDGYLMSDLGNLRFDLELQPDTSGTLRYAGTLDADDFELGILTGNEKILGAVSLGVRLNGRYQNSAFSASLNGNVQSLGLYGYTYSNIALDGQLSNKKYSGSFSIRDPNIDLIFDGSVDFEQPVPRMNFNVKVANLRPYYLGLREDDPEYFASFFLETDLSGIKVDNLNGEIRLVNSLFRRTGEQIQIYDMALLLNNNQDSSFLKLRSELVDAEIKGNYRLSLIPDALKGILDQHFSLFKSEYDREIYDQEFDYTFHIKRSGQAMNFFLPKFTIADNSTIVGSYRPRGRYAVHNFTMFFPEFAYGNFRGYNLGIHSTYDSTLLDLRLGGDSLSLSGELSMLQPDLSVRLANNQTHTDIAWGGTDQAPNAGNITANGILIDSSENMSYRLHVDPSWMNIDNKHYRVSDSRIQLFRDSLQFDSLMISGYDQSVSAHGTYNPKGSNELTISLDNINLVSLSSLLLKDLLAVSGRITGNVVVKSENTRPIITSNLSIDSLYINTYLLGETRIDANWLEINQELKVNVESIREDINSLSVDGSYYPSGNRMDFNVAISDLDLGIMSPYLEDALEELSGNASLSLTVDGTATKPLINGTASFKEASFKVALTQVPYTFTHTLRIYNNDLFIEDLLIRDAYGNSGILNGNLLNTNFSDFRLNADLSAKDLNFLNTTRSDNEQFYGSVFASAEASVAGPLNRLHVEADAVTGRNTNLKLPLYNPDEVQQKDFITFISRSSDETYTNGYTEPSTQSFTLDMDLEIANGAGVQLIFDPNVGDIIDAQGSGNLKIEIDRNQDLNILGQVAIEEGDYLFTLQNVINKRFRVNPGGSIVWNGTPTDAVIDLEAIYELKAATYNLSTDPTPDESLKKRIPVQCILSLEGDLRNPVITPGIEMPTAEPETRTLLQNSTGTDEELMKQFISLLVLNNFLSSEGLGGAVTNGLNSGAVAGVTASELLSNQLSNWLSQISSDFDIGVNYRPGDEITSDEVEVALSTQLLDNRIIISGNVDVGGDQVNTSESNATNIVGDFEMEFRVTDRISVKAYNRANDDFILRNAPYTQGVGVFYRNEFNRFSDLFKKNRDNEKRNESAEPSNEEAIIRED